MDKDINKTPTFLCDEMLRGLTRWLRAAGYDAINCEPGQSDREIIKQAGQTSRLLLTRDRKFTEYREAKDCVIFLEGNDLASCIKDLNRQINMDWLLKPFSRCLLCNTPLQHADAGHWQRVPKESRQLAGTLLHCPQCDKVYWEGSHVRHMRQTLKKWNDLAGSVLDK